MARRASALTASPHADERQMIEAAQRDSRRFAELYENNFERVYAFVLRRVGDRHEAEDLTSEVFHQALRNIGKFEWRGIPFAAWLYRIAANEIANNATSAARRRQLEPDDPPKSFPEEVESRARLFRLVETLPPDQRRVINLRFVEERSIREIAREMQRSEGAVKQLQFRGLQNLRIKMSGNDG